MQIEIEANQYDFTGPGLLMPQENSNNEISALISATVYNKRKLVSLPINKNRFLCYSLGD